MTEMETGDFLTAAAALVSLTAAKGRSVDELALLGAFFTTIGDNLAMMAAARATEQQKE